MEKYQKTNFISMVAEGGLFQIANKFWDMSTVVPLFITAYAGSMTVVGLASTLPMCTSVLVALIFGSLVWKIKNLARFQYYTMLVRVLPLVLAPVVLWASSPQTAIIAFLVIYTIFISLVGILSVTYWDIMARTIPQENRGRLIGLQQVTAGIGGLITGIAIKAILGSRGISDPLRFAILFAGVGFFGLVTAVVMGRVKDPSRKQTQPTGSIIEYIGHFPELLKINPKYCRSLILQAFQNVLTGIFPFLILFEKQHFSLNPEQVSTLVFLQITGTLIGGFVWGGLCRRLGNRGVIKITLMISLFLMAVSIACYYLKDNLPAPMVILGIISVAAGTCQLAFLYIRNYLVDVTDEENRAVYLVMNNTLLFPFSFISLIGGALADRFGFLPLLYIGAAGAVICLIIAKGLLSNAELPVWHEELMNRSKSLKQNYKAQQTQNI